jgi:RNA polymerase sigma-70 factor (ECF subfamily)
MAARKQLDGDALSELFRAHGDGLLAFFIRRTFDGQVAADLVSETFAQAVASRGRFRGSSGAEAIGWLYAIARHQLIGYQRKGTIEMRALRRLGLERQEVTDDELEAIEEAAGIPTLHATIARGLASLSADHRDALELRVVQELPYVLVAERLGVSEQTARARVSRALRRLESILQPTGSASEEMS